MSQQIYRIISGVSILGLVVVLTWAWRLSSRVEELEQQSLAQQTATEQHAALVRNALQELDNKIEDSLDELARLQVAVFPKSERKKMLPEQLARLKNGLYSLERNVEIRKRSGSAYEKKFTIYHLKTEIGSGESTQTIHVGMATSGMTSIPLFYLDYDGDLTVDQDMMFEFVHFIPFGRLAAKTMDPYNSQSAYDAFQESYRAAQFTPVEQITKSGSDLVSGMWKFVQDQSDAILKWIQENDSGKKKQVQTF